MLNQHQEIFKKVAACATEWRKLMFKLGKTKIPHRKNTAAMPAVRMPAPSTVIIPVAQNIGAPSVPCVKVMDKVISLINDVATITENNSENCKNVAQATEEEVNAINNLTATAEETSAMAEELLKLVERFTVWGESYAR